MPEACEMRLSARGGGADSGGEDGAAPAGAGGRPRRPRGASSAPSEHLPQAGEGFWRGVRALGKEANCISLSRFASEPASSCQGEALRRGQDPALQDVCEGMIEKATGTCGFLAAVPVWGII